MNVAVVITVVVTLLLGLEEARLNLLQYLYFCIYFWFSENNKAEVSIKMWTEGEEKEGRQKGSYSED